MRSWGVGVLTYLERKYSSIPLVDAVFFWIAITVGFYASLINLRSSFRGVTITHEHLILNIKFSTPYPTISMLQSCIRTLPSAVPGDQSKDLKDEARAQQTSIYSAVHTRWRVRVTFCLAVEFLYTFSTTVCQNWSQCFHRCFNPLRHVSMISISLKMNSLLVIT